VQFILGYFDRELPDASHLCRRRHFPDLWRTVPILVVDGGGFSAIRFRAAANAHRITGSPWWIGIAGGIEVATGALDLVRRLISSDAHRFWRTPQNARQHRSIATFSYADVSYRLHFGQVVSKVSQRVHSESQTPRTWEPALQFITLHAVPQHPGERAGQSKPGRQSFVTAS